uniref:Uncharacterized protein MANES_03G176900 n=1 Tax=Rhizophora mucronata TaxID=61149 RepID=A0A2P2LH99_RHIMU
MLLNSFPCVGTVRNRFHDIFSLLFIQSILEQHLLIPAFTAAECLFASGNIF